ncbi:hypothetical protein JW905_04735 [bacterium]|nr:hypothetical protein [candidate division CSSED10-310 bacterium]
MMRCSEVFILLTGYDYDEMSIETLAALDKHLRYCISCRAFFMSTLEDRDPKDLPPEPGLCIELAREIQVLLNRRNES